MALKLTPRFELIIVTLLSTTEGHIHWACAQHLTIVHTTAHHHHPHQDHYHCHECYQNH